MSKGLGKAAIGNRKLMDYDALRETVITHRMKTKGVPDCFQRCSGKSGMLNEFV